MPLYEYKCTNCNEIIDKIQKIGEPLFKFCPSCCKDTLVKLFSAPQFTLVGNGFYKQGKNQ